MLADQYILNLSKLSLNMKDLLPEYSGIYYVLDENQTVWYIGQAKNIRKRWQGKSHHRIYQLESQKKYHFYIYYEAVHISDLNNIEKQRIQEYDPHLNKSPVKTKKVRPAETLVRETIAAISNFVFIIGIESAENKISTNRYFKKQPSQVLETVHICLDVASLREKFNVESIEEEKALLSSLFKIRKSYTKQWKFIREIYPYFYQINLSNYIIEIGYWLIYLPNEDSEYFLDYAQTTFVKEPIRALTPDSVVKLKQKMSVDNRSGYYAEILKGLQPYVFDPIKPLFNDSIDREKLRKTLETISEDHKTGKRGYGSRSKVINIDQLIADRSIDLQKYEGKVLSFPNNKIGLYLQCFSFDLKQTMPITSIARGMFDNNLKITVAANLNLVHFLTRVDRQAWLLFEDYFQSFARLATKLNEGEGFIDKFYASARKFIVPAKANIKIESIGYSVWIPFGPAPEFPTFEAATTEIRRRLQESALPDLKVTFTREATTS